MNQAVFLDRDGTINVEIEYLHEPEKFQFIPKVLEALNILQKAGFLLIIITNQGAIGKGLYGHDDVKKTHEYMQQILKQHNIIINAIYYCPHRAEEHCPCRKPQPGMIFQAITQYDIDPHKSWMVGDKLIDIEAGNRANVNTILVETGYGKEEAKKLTGVSPQEQKLKLPTYICPSLWEASNFILQSHFHTK